MDGRQQTEPRECAYAFTRIAELRRDPVEGKFDAARLKEVHRRIFQDLPQHAPCEYRPDAPTYIKARGLGHSG
jgi:cell filamentation protein